MKSVLDACCGPRSFWFDKQDERCLFVVFDPPHIKHSGRGFMVKKYGILGDNWRDVLRHGFAECFRVLAPLGTLVFKWSEYHVPVRDVLALTTYHPLFGTRCGAKSKTHWLVFQKPGNKK